MKTYITLTIDIEIDDPEQFAAAARERAIAEGIDPNEAARDYTGDDDLNACAIMLFDPGVSPPGCTINSSSAEEYTL